MSRIAGETLCDRVLIQAGWPHGFGTRGSQVPENTFFPKQVHGIRVAQVRARGARDMEDSPNARWPAGAEEEAEEADAVLGSGPGDPVGIVTADCVPILVAGESGSGLGAAAIHAGWRGFAAGVIEAGVDALLESAGDSSGRRDRAATLSAAIGPAARGCCYEIDAPVRQALGERYAAWLEPPILVPGRAGHFLLDLPALAEEVLLGLGLRRESIGAEHRLCTICHPDLFESYRRDGAQAGRLRHFIGDSAWLAGATTA